MNKNYLFSLPEDLQSHIWKQYFSDNIIKKLQNPCGWCGKIVDNDDFENCLDYPFDKENMFFAIINFALMTKFIIAKNIFSMTMKTIALINFTMIA